MTHPQQDPPFDEQLREALGQRSFSALASALRSSRFLVPVVSSSDGDVPAVLTSGEGTRSVAAFSGPDAVQAWHGSGPSKVRLVPGVELLRLATHQRIDTVLFDPAGPQPAEIALADLQQLADGLGRDPDGSLRAVLPLQVRPADPPPAMVAVLVDAAREQGVPVWVFERLVLDGAALTVAVEGTAEDAGAVAALLARKSGLSPMDVLLIDEPTARHLHEQVPQALVSARPAGPG